MLSRVAMISSLILIPLAASAPIAAYGQTKTQNVTVVNPIANPVKTTITNAVVPVEVSNFDPIPVAIQNVPGEIVRATQTRSYSAGQSGNCFNPGITVPRGKSLVIEQVSLRGQHVSGDPPTGFHRVVLSAGAIGLEIGPQAQYPGSQNYILSQQVTFYGSEDEVVNLFVQFTGGLDLFLDCLLVGRFIDAS